MNYGAKLMIGTRYMDDVATFHERPSICGWESIFSLFGAVFLPTREQPGGNFIAIRCKDDSPGVISSGQSTFACMGGGCRYWYRSISKIASLQLDWHFIRPSKMGQIFCHSQGIAFNLINYREGGLVDLIDFISGCGFIQSLNQIFSMHWAGPLWLCWWPSDSERPQD